MLRAVAVRRLCMGLLCLGIVSIAGQARADWAMIAVSGAHGPIRERVAERAEATVRSASYDIVSEASAEAVGVTARELVRCGDDQACMQGALAVAEVDRLLLFAVERGKGAEKKRKARRGRGAGRAPGRVIAVKLYDGDSGGLLGAEEGRCQPCSDEEVDRVVEELVTAVLGMEQAEPEVETALRVTSEPPGAVVSIDGQEVGPSGAAYAVEPGPHTVRVTLDGYEAGEQQVEAAPGQVTAVDMMLVARQVSGPGSGGHGVWKWAALGSGAGLAVLGVVGIAIDGPRFDGSGARMSEEWNTLGPGVVATVIGVGLVGVSGYMFYQDASLPAAESRPGVTLKTRGRGVVVGWSGSF